VSHAELWSSAIEAVGVLDCLMALAGAATAADGDVCRPVLLPHPSDASDAAAAGGAGSSGNRVPAGGIFRAKQLRHPAGVGGAGCGSFVPNDIEIGGGAPGFLLLTGPNMGGKSTLLRQVCLAAVLAQVRGAARAARARACVCVCVCGCQ
jgi:DNA mismatch repair protein MSH6